MSAGIFICLVILICLILIWLIYRYVYNNDVGDDDSVPDLYEKTVGYNYDNAAKTGLLAAKQKEKRLAGSNTNEQIENDFIIAELNRFNVVPNVIGDEAVAASIDALQHYQRAVQTLAMVEPAMQTDNVAPPEFIINRAEDYFNEYRAGRPINGLIATGRNRTILRNDLPIFNAMRDTVRNKKLTALNKQARRDNSKLSAQNTYYTTKHIHNDPQNVHESQATYDMQKKYERILQKNATNPNALTIGDLEAALYTHEFDNQMQKSNAISILQRMKQGNNISKLNTSEDQILLAVWKRIHHPDNRHQLAELRASLFDSLSDGMEKNYNGDYREVCAGGRTARIINSLTLFDADADISQPIKTSEILKDEIFTKSHKLIQDELLKIDLDVVKGYNGEPVGDETAVKVSEFETQLKSMIEKNIRNEYKNVDPRVLDNIIKDAQAGV